MLMRESKELEFKERVSDSFLKTVSAFANYGTGEIVFGVNDAGETVGIEDLKENCLRIESKINDAIHPAPRFTIEPVESQQTIVLTVYAGLFKPYLYREKAYKRNDTATLPVDRLELNRLILEGQNLSYDQIQSQQQDLQFEVLDARLQSALGLKGLTDDIMRAFGLKNADLVFTNAAALLADANTFRGVNIVKFGSTINEIQDRRDLDGVSVITLLEEAGVAYERYYRYELIDESAREQIELVPSEAFREALANALVHRTWDVDAAITIAMHPDRIEITSPGGLPTGLSEADYLGGSASVLRNPILGNVFFRLRYIEQLGTGVARIIAAYRDANMQPAFEIRPNSIKVILPVLGSAQFMTSDEAAVYNALDNGFVLSRNELGETTGFSKDKTIRILNALEERKLVTKIGQGRSTRYCR